MAKKVFTAIPNNKKRVDVHVDGHVVVTDHTTNYGGENAAPSMGTVFLAGLVACTTSTARGYCKKHDLPMPEKVLMTYDMDEETELITNVSFEFVVSPDFPEKRYNALMKAAGHCTVKNWWLNPPAFESTVSAE